MRDFQTDKNNSVKKNKRKLGNKKTQKRCESIKNKLYTRCIVKGGGIQNLLNGAPRRRGYNLKTQLLSNSHTLNSNDIYKNYLECVNIRINRGDNYKNNYQKQSLNNENDSIKNFIIDKTFSSPQKLEEIFNSIIKNLPDIGNRIQESTAASNNNNKWVECIKSCKKNLDTYINMELESTAFMLRALTMSLVNDKTAIPAEQVKNPCYNSFGGKIRFEITNLGIAGNTNLTGIWAYDSQYIKLIIDYPDEHPEQEPGKGRLIMGFGPSASGKTYSAAKVIQLMRLVDNNFPSVFLTIDGGLYRETSIIYQAIIKAISAKKQYTGLTNLVEPGLFGSSLFNAGKVKKTIIAYLESQKAHQPINLYVPETLGSCQSITAVINSCYKKYNQYIDLTRDNNWIGLMIYQHKTPENCIYNKNYKCVGTEISGKTRAQEEGKKYSSDAWMLSYKNGNTEVNKAPGNRFRIHNSGTKERPSILEDLSETKILNPDALQETSTDNRDNKEIDILDFLNKTNWKYIPGKVKDYDRCNEYIDGDKIDNICGKNANTDDLTREMPGKTTMKAQRTILGPTAAATQLTHTTHKKNSGPIVNIGHTPGSTNV